MQKISTISFNPAPIEKYEEKQYLITPALAWIFKRIFNLRLVRAADILISGG